MKTGTRFVVLGEGDVVVLKTITPPSSEEFKEIILRARQAAYESEMKPEDILEAIKETRSER